MIRIGAFVLAIGAVAHAAPGDTAQSGRTPAPAVLLSAAENDAKLAELQKRIAEAEKEVAAAAVLGREEFVVWSDKLPEGPNVLEPLGAQAVFEFDELTNGESPNTVEGGKPAKAHGAPTLTDGHHGKALSLVGENGVTLSGVGEFTRNDAFTFSLWGRMSDATERAVVFFKSKAPGYELALEQGRVAFVLQDMGPGNSAKLVAKDALKPGRWTHVAVTHDGSGKAAGLRIFVDGLPTGADVVADTLSKDITDGGGEPALSIGNRGREAGIKAGDVDSFRVYGRALAPIEVASLAGREDFTKAVQSIPELSPEQRTALEEYYIASSHQPSIEARAALKAARDEERKFIAPQPH